TTQALLDVHAQSDRDRRRCRRRLFQVFLACMVLNFVSVMPSLLDRGLHLEELPWAFSLYWMILFLACPVMMCLLGRRCTLSRQPWGWAWGSCLLAEAWALTLPHVAARAQAAVYQPSACVRFLAQKKREHPEEHWRVLDRGLDGEPSSSPLGSS